MAARCSLFAFGMCLVALFWARAAFAISQLSVVGSKFFNEEGEQFFVKGVAYQRTPHDPLVNNTQCKLDANLMEELGVNSIRVYHVDENKDHVECMKTFADAGIYLFVDLDDFPTQIDENGARWNETQLIAFQATLDEFQKYDNTAGLFVGNEVIRTANGSHAAPYILAAFRDLKAYRESKGYRKIPIGYSAADIAELRPMLQNYLVCRPEESETLEFFALNAYEWCGDTSYEESGYANLQKQAEGYPVPIFFSETGCNTVRPRGFDVLTAIFGPEMSDTWSGSMVYEWIQEQNDYGLITYGNKDGNEEKAPGPQVPDTVFMDGFYRQGTPTPLSPEFGNLKSHFKSLSPSKATLSDYKKKTASITAPPCPKPTDDGWELDPSAPLPPHPQKTGTETEKGGAAPPSETETNVANILAPPSRSGTEYTILAVVSTLFNLGGILERVL